MLLSLSKLYRGAISSAAGTAFSRVLGAARDVILARVLGAGAISDAFWVAFTVPTVFRRFVADEGLTGVMVPALTDAEDKEGKEEAQRLSGALFLALVLVCTVLCIAGAWFAPWLVRAFAFGFTNDPEQFSLTVQLTRWMFPFVLFVSLVSWCEGLLNMRDHYFIPKAAPGLVSAGIIVAALFASGLNISTTASLVGGLLIGGLVHFLVCLPAVLKIWGPLRINIQSWSTPRFARIRNEMGKVIAIGVFAQLNIMMLRLLASLLPTGSVTQYWYANRVVDLAQGVIAVAVGSAMLPPISKAVAAGDWTRFEETFVDAARMAAIVLIPAAGLLLAIPDAIVRTLFQHGQFSSAAAELTVDCLIGMVPFMLAVAGINLIKKPFFALDRRDLLLLVGAIGLLFTFISGWGLAIHLNLGVRGLAFALSLSTTVQFIAYVWLLQQKVGASIGVRRLVTPFARMTLGAVPASLSAWSICNLGQFEHGPSLLNIGILILSCAVAAVVYIACAWALNIRTEINAVLRKIRRR